MVNPTITIQPGFSYEVKNWMVAPPSYNGCPVGLEYLTTLDKIVIQQRKEMLEIITDWETNNKYVLRNERGEQIYYAYEETGTCMRICCGPNRSYTIHVVDNFNREVMRMRREFKCCGGCCWCASACSCAAHETVIEAPPGFPIGTVRQRASGCVSAYTVFNAEGKPIFEIDGAGCCRMCGCGDKTFPVYTMPPQHTEVGAITKVWGGAIKEFFTDADTFGVSFPLDLDVKMKAALVGATFLLDFMEFEEIHNNHQS